MAISGLTPDDVAPGTPEPTTYPLHPVDPAKIGDFWPDARLFAAESGVVYLAHEDGATAPVMVILLSQGAAADPAARDRLAGEVDRMDIDTVIARGGLDQDSGDLADKFRSEDDDPHSVDGVPQAPWVALAYDQTLAAVGEARRVLGAVGLTEPTTSAAAAGPDFRLHWADRAAPGLTHVWPLPWPGRRERGGRLSILAAWLLMLLLAATAVLIAILIFSQAPPTPPPPPIPTEATGTGGSPSPDTASPSPSETDTASPSPTEGSPSPSGTDTAGQTHSPPLPI